MYDYLGTAKTTSCNIFRDKIMKNSVQISERRERINDLQEKVNENQSAVAEMISIKIKN